MHFIFNSNTHTSFSHSNYNSQQFSFIYSGNWLDEKPYLKGDPPCTKCARGQFYCNNGLCDSEYSIDDVINLHMTSGRVTCPSH